MNEKRWVQHISGQGEKWEVRDGIIAWRVYTNVSQPDLWLPKSEYHICDPPEVWRDVTEECKVSPLSGSELHLGGFKIYLPMGYRFRKVFRDRQGWSIIVEQKVRP